jgi:endonuclease YncB( thermonuclease family)
VSRRTRQIAAGTVRLAIAAGIAACRLDAAAAIEPIDANCGLPVAETVVAAEAIDGDTIRTDQGREVRLAGIEAPKAYGFGDSALAAAARDALGDLVTGKSLNLAEVGAGPDRYGRSHVQAALGDGGWLQGELVARGWARARPLGGEEACVSALFPVEAAARTAKLGIWADGRYGPWRADDPSLSQQNGLYGIVEGRVLSVGRGSYMVFLDFGRNHGRDFTVMMTSSVAERFAAAGLPAEAWQGRLVRVRGVIEESGGPAIRVEDAIAIEVLDDK